jgi:outer membrane lipoprotein-sorting protein
MKSKVLLATAVILLSGGTTSFAKEDAFNTEIKNVLPDYCVFSGDFTQSRKIAALPTPLISSGKLFFSCQHGLIWNNEKPFAESLIYTSENLHFRKIESNDPTPLDGQQHYHFARFLLNLLSADINSIREQFSIKVKKEVPKQEKTSVTLLPINNILKKGLSSILIEKIIQNEKELLSIAITDQKQQITTLNIENIIEHSKRKKEKIEHDCTILFENSAACNILSAPQAYQPTESNN